MPTIEYRSRFSATPAEVFAFHERPGALESLTPPWETVRVVSREGRGIEAGARVTIETRVGPLWLRWVAVHARYVPGVEFEDRAESGPFRTWEHTHRVEPDGQGGAWLIDRVRYALPLDAIAEVIVGRWVRAKLDRMFAWRHQATARETASRVLEGHGVARSDSA